MCFENCACLHSASVNVIKVSSEHDEQRSNCCRVYAYVLIQNKISCMYVCFDGTVHVWIVKMVHIKKTRGWEPNQNGPQWMIRLRTNTELPTSQL